MPYFSGTMSGHMWRGLCKSSSKNDGYHCFPGLHVRQTFRPSNMSGICGRQHSLKCEKGKWSRPVFPVVQQEEVESIPARSYECTMVHRVFRGEEMIVCITCYRREMSWATILLKPHYCSCYQWNVLQKLVENVLQEVSIHDTTQSIFKEIKSNDSVSEDATPDIDLPPTMLLEGEEEEEEEDDDDDDDLRTEEVVESSLRFRRT
ncbi:hypothetical protein ANN_22629 [Periplaneta americana]|uniref:Uncharacterized protein n=1 Tax=Periplaneta americana TaxID=6978 RepID=A0ABQ8S8Y2_PERAM|nr:hypothetical protein ANN_22629 [Periplaneta americana]